MPDQPTQTALLECDVIMKGGITSGIVYPPAILKLSEKYRFASIGGSSAGGIVAALTAAAECARQSGDPDAFRKMQAAADELSAPGRLVGLFQASAPLRAPLRLFLAILRGKRPLGKLAGLLTGLCINAPVGVLVGVTIGLLLWLGICDAFTSPLIHIPVSWLPIWTVAIRVLATPVIPLIGLLSGALTVGCVLFGRLPKCGYGICSGHRDDASSTDEKPLTDWLHEKINGIAGRRPEDPPLTVADLDRVGVSVRMMTSNLSQGQPYVLPLRDHVFLFKETEMRSLFPDSVVKCLISSAHVGGRSNPPAGYYFMPEPPGFPLIVAARMSLSFPVLIATVPLYTVRWSALDPASRSVPTQLKESDLQRNLFSDGGITSNFPIHFFDAWYPGRPTFGINLTNWSAAAFEDKGYTALKRERFGVVSAPAVAEEVSQPQAPTSVNDAVYLPPANVTAPTEAQNIGSVGGFIAAIFGTAQNYRDNQQTQLPSYRERIVQVRLKDDEGGMNLDMPPEMIGQMTGKGAAAGALLCSQFSMDRHQWVRLLVLMQQLEQQLQEMRTVLTPDEYRRITDAMSTASAAGSPFPYSRDAAWLNKANAAMPALFTLMDEWQSMKCFDARHPHPASVLRVGPNLDVYPDGRPTALPQ